MSTPDPATSRVLVMRHGQSEGNVARVWTSARTGYPLTELGREQATEAALAIRDRGVTALYASALVRAQQTADEVGAVLGLGPVTLPGVEELHVGVHEGRHDDEVGPIAFDVFSRWWRDGDMDHAFEQGESGREIADRMASALGGVADRHPGETVVVVSHGGAIAVGLAAMCENLPAEFVGRRLLANAEVVEIERGPAGWRATAWAGIPLD